MFSRGVSVSLFVTHHTINLLIVLGADALRVGTYIGTMLLRWQNMFNYSINRSTI